MVQFIVLLGPPGAGKGTQAQLLSERFGLAHISSGDIFRENLKAETDLGKLARQYIDKGELVPDDVTIAMVRNRLLEPDCSRGALLDGFPRTLTQSESLQQTINEMGGVIVLVPYISIPDDVLLERLGGRYTCREQGHVFNIKYNPPKYADQCDLDGSELYQREDDKPDTVSNRIQVYKEQTAPLIAYYKKQGLLLEVDGTRPIEAVNSLLEKAIEERIN